MLYSLRERRLLNDVVAWTRRLIDVIVLWFQILVLEVDLVRLEGQRWRLYLLDFEDEVAISSL